MDRVIKEHKLRPTKFKRPTDGTDRRIQSLSIVVSSPPPPPPPPLFPLPPPLFKNLPSGWTFQQIVFYDVRLSRTLPANFVRFGSRTKSITFHPLLRSTFFRNVVDPAPYLHSGFSRDNCCVPACLILSFHFKFGPPLRTVGA